MKKLFVTALAVVCLLSCCMLTVAADTNYCDVFGAGADFFVSQSGSATSAQQICAQAIVGYTLQHLDTTAYEDEGDMLNVPQDVFESNAMLHFAVDAAFLRTIQNEGVVLYDEAIAAYRIPSDLLIPGLESTYAVRGYTEAGGLYTVYYSLAGRDYVIADGDVEGVDYIFDKNGNALGLFGQHAKAVLSYDGTNKKFHSFELLDALPDLSGMVLPETGTKTTTTTVGTTKKTTKATAEKTKRTTTGAKTTTRTTIANGRVTATGFTAWRTTIPTIPMETLFERDGVVMKAAADTFPKGTVLSALPLDNKALDENARWALSNVADLYMVYDLTAVYGGNAIQPKGKVSVTIAIPEGFEPSRTAVVYISEGGAAEVLVSKVDRVSGTVTADLSHFSTYAVAQLFTAGSANGPDTTWFFVIVAVVAIGVGCGVFFIMRKRALMEAAANAAEDAQATDAESAVFDVDSTTSLEDAQEEPSAAFDMDPTASLDEELPLEQPIAQPLDEE